MSHIVVISDNFPQMPKTNPKRWVPTQDYHFANRADAERRANYWNREIANGDKWAHAFVAPASSPHKHQSGQRSWS